MPIACNSDMQLLHRLQERRLGAGAGAVDLVGHQQLAEDRAGDEAEAALAGDALFEHLAADDIGRHQVGGELDAARLEPEHDAHGLDQLGLGEAGQPHEQRMAAGEHGHERLLDHPLLSENDVADCRLGGRHLRRRRFRLAHDCVVEPFDHLTAGYRHIVRSLSRLVVRRLPDPLVSLAGGLGHPY